MLLVTIQLDLAKIAIKSHADYIMLLLGLSMLLKPKKLKFHASYKPSILRSN
ncbi:MAG: hypothetical protein ACJZ8F_04455 [Candidatus Pelagibacter sp.]